MATAGEVKRNGAPLEQGPINEDGRSLWKYVRQMVWDPVRDAPRNADRADLQSPNTFPYE